jgi:hypothetical protein
MDGVAGAELHPHPKRFGSDLIPEDQRLETRRW